MRLAIGLFLALLFGSVAAQTITIPLPVGCVAALTAGSTGDYTVSCGGTPPTPPTPPPGPIHCAGYDKTTVITEPWTGTHPRQYSGARTTRDALVIQVTTGSVGVPDKLGAVTVAEWQSPPSWRTMTLSATPCDFGTGIARVGPGQTVRILFGVGPPQPGYPVLKINTTYYFNVADEPQSSCGAAGGCDVYIDFVPPRGS